MKISIVTPNFNGRKFLNNYFNSLIKDKSFIGEIIIVDNGSIDDSVIFIEDISKKLDLDVKIIKNNENFGFAKAVNQGIKIASFDYIFLLNNDTKIEEGTISNLIKCISKSDKIFSVQSKMIQFENKNLIDDAGDEYTLFGWTKKAGNNLSIEKYSKKREIFSSCAGAALYNKDILNKIGLFDENFFAYMEDVDIGYRAQIYGFKNFFCPESIVYHIGSGTSGSKYNEFKVKIAARNNIWIIHKNFPLAQKIINFIFLFFGFLIKYLFFVKKGYGSLYLEGIKEGLNSKHKIDKIEYDSENLNNYLKIELKLIKNTLKLLKK